MASVRSFIPIATERDSFPQREHVQELPRSYAKDCAAISRAGGCVLDAEIVCLNSDLDQG